MRTIRSHKRVRKKKEIFFPDDIIINILSRLPAKSVVRCRVVCRGWRDLTSTHDFKELHMRGSIRMIFVSHPGTTARLGFDGYHHLLLNKWWEPRRKRLVYNRFVLESENPVLLCEDEDVGRGMLSHGGLIVFKNRWNNSFVIVNPLSHENVRIKLSKELDSSDIYGVFFHLLLREYCTLWRIYVGVDYWRDYDKGCYTMLNLGSNPCWKGISNPWMHRVRVGGPIGGTVLIGEYLYWLVHSEVRSEESTYDGRHDVMGFDIRSENFDLIHCPVPLDVDCLNCEISLLDIDGVLSYVLISQDQELMNVSIWKLKDCPQQEWVPMNRIIWTIDSWTFGRARATAVVDNEVALFSDYKFHVCNLNMGTVRTFPKKYKNPLAFFYHVMSLASLKNCKSKITMDKEGVRHGVILNGLTR